MNQSTKIRSLNLMKNIFYSFIIKFGIAVFGLLLLPLNLQYLNQSDYGVWLTVASISNWLYVFDIGLGNGLRNRFTYSVTQNNDFLAKKYVSTTYAIILILVCFLFLVFTVSSKFINWNVVFNLDTDPAVLNFLVVITFLSLLLRMFFSVLTTVLIAFHKVSIANLIEFIASFLILITTYFVLKFSHPSILKVGIIHSFMPIVVLLIASIVLYKSTLSKYLPSIGAVDFGLSKFLFNKGIQFFIIQLSALLMLVVNQVLVARLYGPAEVTVYAIVSKYFSIPLIGFGIVVIPFWSSFGESYIKGDFDWIRKMIKRLLKVWMVASFGIICMIFLFPVFLKLWINQPIQYSNELVLYFGLYVVLNTWTAIFNQLNNALDKLHIQLLGAVFILLVQIPLSLFFYKYLNMGSEGVLLSACIGQLPGAILSAIQYYLVINNKAKGIWNS